MAKAKTVPTKTKAATKPKKVVVDYGVEMPEGIDDPVSNDEIEDLVSGFVGGEPMVVVSDVPPEEQRQMQVEPVTGIGDGKVVWGQPIDTESNTASTTTPAKITMDELRTRAEAFTNAAYNFTVKPKAD